MFAAGYLAWTCDAFDFFTVSMTVTEIATDFGVPDSDVSWVSKLPFALWMIWWYIFFICTYTAQGITITLMLRSVGALFFGFLSDRYGRKWPVIINLFLFSVLELASGFCKTLPQFLGIRSLYGIAMGGKR
jgi:SHS family lactate transporter-like MFS transporter